jgi:hypothetical protein
VGRDPGDDLDRGRHPGRTGGLEPGDHNRLVYELGDLDALYERDE